jgi:hypothetical protein
MKVIDLLNKIANGELEFEQEFKHNEVITDMEMFSNEYLLNEEILNNKIEIIEEQEDKKIENIYFSLYDFQRNERDTLEKIEKKFNELIDEVNKLKGDNNE